MKRLLLYAALSSLVLLVGCAGPVPKSIALPWNRTLSSEKIIPKSSMSISVECESTPLLGSNQLADNEIAATASDLLARRGFIISEDNPKYKMRIKYRTEIIDQKLIIGSSYLSNPDSSAGSVHTGLGVALALTMAKNYAWDANYPNTVRREQDMYKHRLVCEIDSADNQVIWQNESFVDCHQLDILSGHTSLLQIAFSALPTTNEVIPRMKKMNSKKLMDFANVYTNRNLHMCPALPHYIAFMSSRNYGNNNIYSKFDPLGVSDPSAILAYIDLIRTAEYAIPSGTEKDWRDPTQKSLWNQVTLIGRYYLGQDETPVNVVIDLQGSLNYYIVNKCRLVSDKKYQQYLDKYDAWKRTLVDYYSFFED